MILQALTKLYEDLAQQGKIAKPGWSKAKISYALCINEEGELEQIIPLIDDDKGKKSQPRQFDLPAPVKRTVGIEPNFLWDNSSYLLGIDTKGKPERSRQCFRAAQRLHHAILDDLDTPVARGILCFFDHWDPENTAPDSTPMPDFEAAVSGVNLLFRIN